VNALKAVSARAYGGPESGCSLVEPFEQRPARGVAVSADAPEAVGLKHIQPGARLVNPVVSGVHWRTAVLRIGRLGFESLRPCHYSWVSRHFLTAVNPMVSLCFLDNCQVPASADRRIRLERGFRAFMPLGGVWCPSHAPGEAHLLPLSVYCQPSTWHDRVREDATETDGLRHGHAA
jgi:hypothetical protein